VLNDIRQDDDNYGTIVIKDTIYTVVNSLKISKNDTILSLAASTDITKLTTWKQKPSITTMFKKKYNSHTTHRNGAFSYSWN